jgi:copper transport protein
MRVHAVPHRTAWLILASAIVLGLATTASAHAVLQGSTPAHASVFPSAPGRLELRFNEPVDPRLSTATLIAGGTRTTLEPLAGDGRRLSYRLPALPEGLYTVDWRVISTLDGHLTRGALSFGVGRVTVPSAAQTGATAPPPWTEVVARWVGLTGLFLLIGGSVAFFWLPVPAAAAEPLRRRLYAMAVGATTAIALSGVYRVFESAAALGGTSAPASVMAAALARVLADSHAGHDLIFRGAGAVFMTLMLRPHMPLERQGVLALIAVLMIGPVLTSHGPTVGWHGIVVSALHVLAACSWIGGLAYFGIAYLPVVHRLAPHAVRGAALRFSRLGLIAVIVLIATGIAQGAVYLGSPAALVRPGYGRTLLVKLIVLAPLLALAAVNRWGIVPRLAGLAGLWRSLMVVVRLEAALALSVALIAAAVGITPPARSAQAPAEAPPRLVLGGTAGDVTLTVTISPAGLGANTVTLAAAGPGGAALTGDVRYIVSARALTQDTPPVVLRVDGRLDGSTTGDGPFIAAPGWWSLDVVVRRRGVEDVAIALPLLVDPRPPGDSEAAALALLRDAEAAATSARVWQEVEHFSTGDGVAITRHYVFAVPDRLMYTSSLGVEGRVIGRRSFARDRGGAWTLTERPDPVRIVFRFPLATGAAGARLGVRTEAEGRRYQVVTYADPGGRLSFAVWIDLDSRLPARLFMVGEAHYMTAVFSDYNRTVEITPP